MVNVKNLFGMAVMATALVGCSSSDDLATDVKGNESKTEAAYASFKINLPTTTGTRAVDPKTGTEFNGGTAAEYEVKNGTILIFDATTDLFVTSAELGTMNPWTADTDDKGVTTAAIATVKLTDVSTTGSYKALVLLNNNVGATKKKVELPATTEKYADWSKDVDKVNVSDYESTDGFFMANAPKYIDATSEPETLVPVAHVCASREQAEAMGATTVYVERGLAKVTMENFDTDGYTVADGTYKDATVKIENWKLDVTNKSTFPVHQIGGLSTDYTGIWGKDRFYNGTNTVFKRVYWGTDPNYSTDKYYKGDNTVSPERSALDCCKDAFNMITNAQVDGVAGQDKPQYCLENTFNLANMKQGQTTRVVFKAQFIPKGCTAAETFYKIGNNTAIWKKADLEKQILAVATTVMNLTSAEAADYKVKLDAAANNISGEAGQHMITADNFEYTGSGTSKVPAALAAINTKLGLSEADPTNHKEKVGISTYLNGEAYYIARIKHFNELTQWNPGNAYESHNDLYLGRYGVLRNNWYSLSVHTVSGLGYPEVPTVKPEIPDDENNQYINVEVKILDWAKRSQSIDL